MSEGRSDWGAGLFVVGLLLALGGSYLAVTEAFGDHEFCNQLGCIDTRNPEDIWFGLVACAIGAVLIWRNRRRST